MVAVFTVRLEVRKLTMVKDKLELLCRELQTRIKTLGVCGQSLFLDTCDVLYSIGRVDHHRILRELYEPRKPPNERS
jgi:hypothetical protein